MSYNATNSLHTYFVFAWNTYIFCYVHKNTLAYYKDSVVVVNAVGYERKRKEMEMIKDEEK
jgi:hypothetical protein